MPDFPTSPAPLEVTTKKRHYNVRSEAINGRTQVRSLGSERREFTVKFPPMSRSEFATIYAFIDAKGGGLESFTIYVPDPTSTTAFDFTTGDGCEEVTVRQANDLQEYAIGINNHYRFELDLIEVI